MAASLIGLEGSLELFYNGKLIKTVQYRSKIKFDRKEESECILGIGRSPYI